jgi:hypothetical protein
MVFSWLHFKRPGTARFSYSVVQNPCLTAPTRRFRESPRSGQA